MKGAESLRASFDKHQLDPESVDHVLAHISSGYFKEGLKEDTSYLNLKDLDFGVITTKSSSLVGFFFNFTSHILHTRASFYFIIASTINAIKTPRAIISKQKD